MQVALEEETEKVQELEQSLSATKSKLQEKELKWTEKEEAYQGQLDAA